jgi:hypothetical protein
MSKLKKWSTGSLTMMSNPKPNPDWKNPGPRRPMSSGQKFSLVGCTSSAAFGPNPQQSAIDRWERLRNDPDPEIRALVERREKHGTLFIDQKSV